MSEVNEPLKSEELSLSIEKLEEKSGLTSAELLKFAAILPSERGIVYPNHYKAALLMLVYGHRSLNSEVKDTASKSSDEKSLSDEFYRPVIIRPETYHTFIDVILPGVGLSAIAEKHSVAGNKVDQDGKSNLHPMGQLGKMAFLAQHSPNSSFESPFVGISAQHKILMEKHLPGFAQKIYEVCEAVQTKSFLRGISVGSFGGLQEIISAISGAVESFYSALYCLYKGVQTLIQQVKMWIHTQIMLIQRFIIQRFFNEKIIAWLSLVCALLSSVQTLLNDIGFFATLFNGSDSLFKALNAVQKIVNVGSQIMDYIANPITSGLANAFPKKAQAFADFLKSMDKIPERYLGNLLKTYSFNKSLHSRGIMIANAIIKRYGLGSQLGELNNLLLQFGTAMPNNSSWYRQGAPVLKGVFNFTNSQIWDDRDYRINPKYDIFTYDANGKPLFTWKGIKNSFTSAMDLVKVPEFRAAYLNTLSGVGGLVKSAGLIEKSAEGSLKYLRETFKNK